MSPIHSIGFCPICGGGLCGIRVCGIKAEPGEPDANGGGPHGLVICDECEAIWLEPDLTTAHQYPSAEDPRCPICSQPLWGAGGCWANHQQVELLGWEEAIRPELDSR